jgi:hypothetical protein
MITFAIILGYIASIVAVVYLTVWIGKRNARHFNEYEKAYSAVTKDLLGPIDPKLKDDISDRIDQLEKMKHKNKEKMVVLKLLFRRRYGWDYNKILEKTYE